MQLPHRAQTCSAFFPQTEHTDGSLFRCCNCCLRLRCFITPSLALSRHISNAFAHDFRTASSKDAAKSSNMARPTARPRRSPRYRAKDCWIKRVILLGQVDQSPVSSFVFGDNGSVLHVGIGTTGVQDKGDGVSWQFGASRLNGGDKRISEGGLWDTGQGLLNGFACENDAGLIEDGESGRQVRVAVDALVPVLPVAVAQILLKRIALLLTIVKVKGQGMLEREKIFLHQEKDIERRGHLGKAQKHFNQLSLD